MANKEDEEGKEEGKDANFHLLLVARELEGGGGGELII